jgi:secreted PhoX family phosphatase
MTRITRRDFGSLAAAGAAGVSLAPLTVLFAPRVATAKADSGWGPLVEQFPSNMKDLPAHLQDIAFMSMPKPFHYALISYAGQTMRDGNPVPGAADGMAAFRGDRGRTILVRNHELTTSGTPVVADATYDPQVRGGTSNLVVDGGGHLIEQWGSLAGTERNCAGGPTPWGTWLTCEETTSIRNGVRHGYVFEVDPNDMGDPEPLKRLGRFSHEAAAVDPGSGAVYLTEDRSDSLFYRFVPAAPGDLRSPGRLQALRLRDYPKGVHTRSGFLASLGKPLPAEWVPIDDYDPAADTTRVEGRNQGAALFSRGEGCWYGNERIYFVSTDGGELRRGQIFAYDPAAESLTLVVESTDAALLDAPDNITVGPDGRLYVCEDGSGGGDNIVTIDHDGSLAILAQNISSDSEWAGACFSSPGNTLFVNMQGDGLTFALSGPFKRSSR